MILLQNWLENKKILKLINQISLKIYKKQAEGFHKSLNILSLRK